MPLVTVESNSRRTLRSISGRFRSRVITSIAALDMSEGRSGPKGIQGSGEDPPWSIRPREFMSPRNVIDQYARGDGKHRGQHL